MKANNKLRSPVKDSHVSWHQDRRKELICWYCQCFVKTNLYTHRNQTHHLILPVPSTTNTSLRLGLPQLSTQFFQRKKNINPIWLSHLFGHTPHPMQRDYITDFHLHRSRCFQKQVSFTFRKQEPFTVQKGMKRNCMYALQTSSKMS